MASQSKAPPPATRAGPQKGGTLPSPHKASDKGAKGQPDEYAKVLEPGDNSIPETFTLDNGFRITTDPTYWLQPSYKGWLKLIEDFALEKRFTEYCTYTGSKLKSKFEAIGAPLDRSKGRLYAPGVNELALGFHCKGAIFALQVSLWWHDIDDLPPDPDPASDDRMSKFWGLDPETGNPSEQAAKKNARTVNLLNGYNVQIHLLKSTFHNKIMMPPFFNKGSYDEDMKRQMQTVETGR